MLGGRDRRLFRACCPARLAKSGSFSFSKRPCLNKENEVQLKKMLDIDFWSPCAYVHAGAPSWTCACRHVNTDRWMISISNKQCCSVCLYCLLLFCMVRGSPSLKHWPILKMKIFWLGPISSFESEITEHRAEEKQCCGLLYTLQLHSFFK